MQRSKSLSSLKSLQARKPLGPRTTRRSLGSLRSLRSLIPGAGLAAVIVLCAACGSSTPSGSGGTGSTSSSSTSSMPTGTTEAPSGPGAKIAIDKAFDTLFDLANPAVAPKLAVIEGGAALKSTFESALKSPIAKIAGGAKVLTVTSVPSATCTNEALPVPCEAVSFNVLSLAGKKLIGDNGFAVYTGGRWLVAKQTICGLLALAAGGKEPAGCS
jgi:hypothetical protein